MKRNRLFISLIIIIVVLPYLTVSSQKMDSTVYGNSGQIEIIILQRQNSLEEEYRFYNERGFYCFSFYKEKSGDFRSFDNGKLLKYHTWIKPEIDPIFTADTFSIGFVNIMKGYNEIGYNSRFNHAIDHYYQTGCEPEPKHIAKFKENHQKVNYSYYNEFDSAMEVHEIVYLETVPHDQLPKMPDGFELYFKQKILKGISFDQNEKFANSNQLIFTIYVLSNGSIKSIELISKLEKNNVEEINSRIREGIPKFFPGRSLPSTRTSILKAAFYINMD